ncbi:MAG: hypothetical protein AAF532_07540 [Planctomycetota bacterium]
MNGKEWARREAGRLARNWSLPPAIGRRDTSRYADDATIFAVRSPVDLLRDRGVRFTGRVRSPWHECHAVDREDRQPSAAVHAETGSYKDSGGGEDRRFWDLVAELDGLSDWRAARDRVVRELGLGDPDDRRGNPYRPAPPRPRPEKNEPARARRDVRPSPVFPTVEAAADDLRRMFDSPGMRSKGFVPDDGPPTLYRYHDADGRLVGAVCRINGTKTDGSRSKRIRPLRRDAGGWRQGAMPASRPLYRLPELIATATAGPAPVVLVVEGEKAADAVAGLIDDLGRAGLCCPFAVVTNAGGSSAIARTDWGPLAGRRVLLWPDRDAAGRKWRDGLTRTLSGLPEPARVRWLDVASLWPEVGEADDAFDWIESRDAVPTEMLVDAILAASFDPHREGGAA